MQYIRVRWVFGSQSPDREVSRARAAIEADRAGLLPLDDTLLFGESPLMPLGYNPFGCDPFIHEFVARAPIPEPSAAGEDCQECLLYGTESRPDCAFCGGSGCVKLRPAKGGE